MMLSLLVGHPRTCRGAFVIAAVLTATLAARAAEAPPPCANCPAAPTLPSADIVPDAPARPPAPPNHPAAQAQPPGCAQWTDRCITCERDAGKIICSNIGIACQPQAIECVRSQPAEEKKQGN